MNQQQGQQQPTNEELLEFLNKLRPKPTNLVEQLQEDYEFAIKTWMNRTKEDWLRRYSDYGDDIYNYLHPSQKNELHEMPRSSDNWYLATGKIESSLRTKGVRKKMYSLAFNNVGYYDENHPAAFEYDDEGSLLFHVIFKTEENAERFRVDVTNASMTHNSPLNGLLVEIEVRSCPALSEKKLIGLTDYDTKDSGSPEDAISIMSPSEYSFLEATSDIFKYQRIESLQSFYQKGPRAQSCHLINKSHCRKFDTYSKYENDENNVMAMSLDIHGFFDGFGTLNNYPIFILKYVSCSPGIVYEERYEVQLCVRALDTEASRVIFPRLLEGSRKTGNDLEMNVSVYVKNIATFRFCLEWKMRNTLSRWKECGIVLDGV